MPSNSFDTCSLSPGDYSAGIAEQIPQLRQEAIRYIALNDPYSNLVEGGTTQNNQGEQIRTLVTSRLVTGHSLTAPAFAATSASCGTSGEVAQYGQTEFTTSLETLRGEGPLICLNQARFAVIDSYRMAEQNLKDAIKTLNSADIRYQLLALSGVKATLRAGVTSLGATLTGGYNQVSVPFNHGYPNSPLSYKYLVALSHFMRDTLSPEFFGSGADQHFVFVGSSEIIEVLRNEAGVKQDVLGLVTGNDMSAQGALKRYSFIDFPYRGLKLAIDQQPLRFDVMTNNMPVFIEPLISQTTSFGVENAVNDDWVEAGYEVGFLVSKGTFKRLVPERFVGEGSMKFDPQFVMGELEWFYQRDNVCNKWGDFGRHLYQIVRAFQARRPHGVIPIIYKRCAQDLGLSSCSGVSSVIV